MSEPVIDVAMPLQNDNNGGHSDYYNIYNENNILDVAVIMYLASFLNNAYFDNLTSIHSNRMRAMDNATKNSEDLSFQLKLSYNKIRQAIITNELSDIVSGSEATA